jgi:hypothetical protein
MGNSTRWGQYIPNAKNGYLDQYISPVGHSNNVSCIFESIEMDVRGTGYGSAAWFAAAALPHTCESVMFFHAFS